jgi:hypothetical protein
MLIDLDLAKELDSSPGRARHWTGTMEFMAIKVLDGRSHIDTILSHSSTSSCGSLPATAGKRIRICPNTKEVLTLV